MRRNKSLQLAVLILVIALLSFSIDLFASLAGFPGMIPKTTKAIQATDLISEDGLPITSEEVSELAINGKDISRLNPLNSELWKNSPPSPLDQRSYSLDLPEGGELQFESDDLSTVGTYRFIVSQRRQGSYVHYKILLSKKAHNILLRKAILEKLGYTVENLQWLARVKIHFNGGASKLGFLQSIRNNAEADPQRWTGSDNSQSDDSALVLQDVIAFPIDTQFYNLEMGKLLPQAIQGRRFLSSLLIPYALTDVPESLNTFSWTSGRVVNNSAYLPYEFAEYFKPSFQDSQWIVRRIGALQRSDFQEIARAAQLPEEATFLLTEKLISRRNSLLKLFEIEDLSELSFDASISAGERLIHGKLTQEFWPGYASRLSFGDPENPMSASELKSFLSSRVVSSLIQSNLASINSYLNNNSALKKNIGEHQLEVALDQLTTALATGKEKKVPFGMYAFPSLAGSLIFSREVVVGSFMGTDNLVQMADSFGAQLNPGIFLGFDGMPNGYGMIGQLGLNVLRTYSHVKPLKSIKAANKTPFKNMLIPLLMKRYSENLDEAEDSTDLEALATALDKDLLPGESLIITDSISAQEQLKISHPIHISLSVQGQLMAAQTQIRRIQIYKVDKYNFQIYDDPGTYNSATSTFGLGLKGVPILSFSIGKLHGSVKTELHTLNIGSEDEGYRKKFDSDYRSSLIMLRQILFNGSLEALSSSKKPYQFSHQIKSRESGTDFLYYRSKDQSISDRVLFSSPDNVKRAILYRSSGLRTGKDFATLVAQIASSYLNERTGSEHIIVDATSSGNPGDTINGSAATRMVVYQAQQDDPTNGTSKLNDSVTAEFAQVSYGFKGWELSKDGLLKHIKLFNSTYGLEFVNPILLTNTEKISLYSIQLTINVYRDGIRRLSELGSDKIDEIFRTAEIPSPACNLPHDESCSRSKFLDRKARIQEFKVLQGSYINFRHSNGPKAADAATKLIDRAELYFPGIRFIKLVGEENIFAQVRIQGFREGDETGDSPILGYTLGLAGDRAPSGPISFIQQNLGILNGELFLNWLVNPL